MRWAIIGDIHSQRHYLEAVLADVRRHRPDQVALLGDLFEVKVPKEAARRFSFQGMEEVLDLDPALLEVLTWARVLKGNQEERLLRLVPPERLPPELLVLNRLPRRLELNGGVVLMHGHQFRWLNPRDDIYHPALWGRPPRVLILGHNHQNAVFRLERARWWPWGWRVEPLPLRYGAAVVLERSSHYLVNVADVRRPSWLWYDAAAGTLTFHEAAGLALGGGP